MKITRFVLLFTLLCLYSITYSQSNHQLKDSIRKAKAYSPIHFGLGIKGYGIVIPVYYLATFYDLGIEYTHKNFHDYYVGYKKNQTSPYSMYTAYSIGYNYPLQKRIFPFHLQFCARYVETYHTTNDGEWNGPFNSSTGKGASLQFGLGKKLRLIGNLRLETSIGLFTQYLNVSRRTFDSQAILASRVQPDFAIKPYLNLKISLSYFRKKHASKN